MAKVLKSDLSGGGLEAVISMLEGESSDTETLLNAINSFVNGSTKTLTGDGYNAARQKMSLYTTDISSRSKIAAQLSSAISNGASSLSSYMEGYGELDDSLIPEVEESIATLNSQIANARATINRIIANNANSENPVSTSSYTAQINAWEATKKELEKYLEKLVGLGSADGAAFGAVEAAVGQVEQYSASVQGIRVSSIN